MNDADDTQQIILRLARAVYDVAGGAWVSTRKVAKSWRPSTVRHAPCLPTSVLHLEMLYARLQWWQKRKSALKCW